jgi:hypothetical protein
MPDKLMDFMLAHCGDYDDIQRLEVPGDLLSHPVFRLEEIVIVCTSNWALSLSTRCRNRQPPDHSCWKQLALILCALCHKS